MESDGSSTNDQCGTSTSTVSSAHKLVSFWDLIGADREDNSNSMLDLEVKSELFSPNSTRQIEFEETAREGPKITEVDFTAKSPEVSAEAHAKTPKSGRINSPLSRQNEFRLVEQIGGESGLCNFSKLLNKILPAELVTEDTWMDRLRRVIERNDRHEFELIGPYTNPLWHQLSVESSRAAATGSSQENSLRASWSGGDFGYFSLFVVAPHA